MQINNKSAFTLVELIVVITILAILGTIAFISLQWFSADARDSSRISDVNNIKKSLEFFNLATWIYPFPDNAENVTYSWTVVVWKQWTIWDTVTSQLSRQLHEKPTDPSYETEYIYSTLEDGSKYEVMSVYESLAQNTIPLLNNTYADTPSTVRVDGTYNGLHVKTWNYIIPTPSIITSLNPTGLDLDITTITSQVIAWGTNIPDIWTDKITQSTWALTFLTFEVYNWALDNNSSTWALLDAYNAIANTYIWSSVANIWIIKTLLTKSTDNEKITFTETVVLNTTSSVAVTNNTPTYSCTGNVPSLNVSTSNNTWLTANTAWQNTSSWDDCYYECTGWYTGANCDVAPPPTWWRALDSNCDIEDITIWTQTWAWCNSTLWNGFEFWQTNADIWTSNYNWTVWSCYDYNWNDTATCTKWDITMASSTKANTWFSGSNSNWDSEYANIWWKLYTWSNSSSACPDWRHVPSDEEWDTLEIYLNWWNYCRNPSGSWECDADLWWNGHNTKTDTNNLANALKIPLAGHRESNGSTFKHRGLSSVLWSSQDRPGNTAYRRYMSWSSSMVYRDWIDRNYGFSVRCIKD